MFFLMATKNFLMTILDNVLNINEIGIYISRGEQ